MRQMRILVSDPAPLGDLVAYLRRCGCHADIVGQTAVEATPPERPSVGDAYLRLELDAYLRVWREMHSGVKAELVDSPKNGQTVAIPSVGPSAYSYLRAAIGSILAARRAG
jgi:hypothetical protein